MASNLSGFYGPYSLLSQAELDKVIADKLAQRGYGISDFKTETGAWSPAIQEFPGWDVPLVSIASDILDPARNPNMLRAGMVDMWGRPISDLDYNNYTIMGGIDPSHGADNKYETIDSWKQAGAFYDPSKSYFNQWYWVPNNFTPPGSTTSVPNTNKLGDFVDLNPDVPDEWGLIPFLAPLALGLIGGGALGLFGSGAAAGGAAAEGLVDTAASPFFGNAWNAGNAAALNLGGVASAVPELNLLGAGASSLASSIPSLANALSVYGVTPIPSMDVYNAANMVGGQSSLWDKSKDFLKDNAGSIAKTAASMFQQPAGQTMPSIPDFSVGASGGTQPTQQRSIAQQQQSQPYQLSVPQFNQMPGPQQDYGNYQAPQFMDASQGWGDPSVFQLSQSTWNPSMANALRSYNG